MPRISCKDKLAALEEKKALLISLRRAFRAELKKLRNLDAPNLSATSYSWSLPTLTINYHAKLADMRDSEKWLRRFSLIGPLEGVKSSDSDDGTREFSLTYQKGKNRLQLFLYASPDDGNPQASCRKMQVGTDTHTHTYTTPKYQIVCD